MKKKKLQSVDYKFPGELFNRKFKFISLNYSTLRRQFPIDINPT